MTPRQVNLAGVEVKGDAPATSVCCPVHGWSSRCSIGSCQRGMTAVLVVAILAVVALAGCSNGGGPYFEETWVASGCFHAYNRTDKVEVCAGGHAQVVVPTEGEEPTFSCSAHWWHNDVLLLDQTRGCTSYTGHSETSPTLSGIVTWALDGDGLRLKCSLQVVGPGNEILRTSGTCARALYYGGE